MVEMLKSLLRLFVLINRRAPAMLLHWERNRDLTTLNWIWPIIHDGTDWLMRIIVQWPEQRTLSMALEEINVAQGNSCSRCTSTR